MQDQSYFEQRRRRQRRKRWRQIAFLALAIAGLLLLAGGVFHLMTSP